MNALERTKPTSIEVVQSEVALSSNTIINASPVNTKSCCEKLNFMAMYILEAAGRALLVGGICFLAGKSIIVIAIAGSISAIGFDLAILTIKTCSFGIHYISTLCSPPLQKERKNHIALGAAAPVNTKYLDEFYAKVLAEYELESQETEKSENEEEAAAASERELLKKNVPLQAEAYPKLLAEHAQLINKVKLLFNHYISTNSLSEDDKIVASKGLKAIDLSIDDVNKFRLSPPKIDAIIQRLNNPGIKFKTIKIDLQYLNHSIRSITERNEFVNKWINYFNNKIKESLLKDLPTITKFINELTTKINHLNQEVNTDLTIAKELNTVVNYSKEEFEKRFTEFKHIIKSVHNVSDSIFNLTDDLIKTDSKDAAALNKIKEEMSKKFIELKNHQLSLEKMNGEGIALKEKISHVVKQKLLEELAQKDSFFKSTLKLSNSLIERFKKLSSELRINQKEFANNEEYYQKNMQQMTDLEEKISKINHDVSLIQALITTTRAHSNASSSTINETLNKCYSDFIIKIAELEEIKKDVMTVVRGGTKILDKIKNEKSIIEIYNKMNEVNAQKSINTKAKEKIEKEICELNTSIELLKGKKKTTAGQRLIQNKTALLEPKLKELELLKTRENELQKQYMQLLKTSQELLDKFKEYESST
jgi:chromosome segregation ATPase